MQLNRRHFLAGSGALAASSGLMPAWAQSVSAGLVRPLPVVSGTDIALTIGTITRTVDGKSNRAVAVNGTVPAPLIRLKEGQDVRLRVTNSLREDSSIHWHGLILPFQMDGVPGISFPGIRPGQTFDYAFKVQQAGTYWYHSHSAYQEQDGLYGPIVIDPVGAEHAPYDREHVIVLSDHSPLAGAAIFRKLKQNGEYFSRQEQTFSGVLAGRDMPHAERMGWARMRMSPADISDVTGNTYTFTVNGHGPFDNWTGLFTPGERVRLRIVNAAAQSNFNVRIPDLPMTVVQADGLDVRPVTVDEFQIGVAETFDVIVTPGDRAYTFVSEAVDRSGLGRATLAPRAGMTAPVPPLRPRPLLSMKDMGMAMGAEDPNQPNIAARRGVDPSAEQNASRDLWKMSGWNAPTDHGSTPATPAAAAMDHAAMGHGSMDHSGMDPASADHGGMDHGAMGHGGSGGMDHDMRDFSKAPGVKQGPGVDMISPMPMDRTGEPPLGLEGLDHRVLTYRDLMAATRNPDIRAPSRQLDIHLTGNMERYMWSFDGVKLSEPAEPIPFRHNERVRVNLINDTMMQHPIHLHGHFFELVTGHGAFALRKHTVTVAPGGKVSFDVTADALGDWAFHCHNLYHMTAGMMRVVTVRAEGQGNA